MPAAAQFGVRTAHPTIQRFFDVSLYLLLFTGFGMLAGTGKLDALSLILGTAALLGKGYVLMRQVDTTLPEHWTTYLTLVYVAFFGLDYFLISQTFIGSLVHMVLFAAMVKLFSIHRERDYLYLGILAFGMVLAAAVLTVDSLFFVIFCIFVLLAVMTFVSMEMRRSWIASRPPPTSELRDIRDLRRLPGSVSRACVLLVLSIVLGTIALFFLIPRKPSAGYLSAFASHSDISTGFSEDVRLGQIGTIQQSSTVLMHVKFAPEVRTPSDLHWRGVALTTFENNRWTGPHEDGALEAAEGSMFPETRHTARLFVGSGRRVNYKVSLEPFGSRVFFVLPEALLIDGHYQMLRVDSTGSIFNLDNSRAITDYTVVSELPPPMRVDVGPSTDVGVSKIVYLQTPQHLDPRVRQLAAQITASESTPFRKASLIERYLATSFGYTLQQPSVPPKDPIANFLFERRQGHCEYFASAMAIMLRTIGIPSRVVNGFRGGEYNDVTGSYIIRASDAHSWVEAYFPGYGWYTFDPTPAGVANPTRMSRLYLYMDAMREFWHDWVVNYDTGHQTMLGFTAVRQSRSGIEHLRVWAQSLYSRALERTTELRINFERNAKQWTVWLSSGLALLVFLLISIKLWTTFRRLRLVRKPQLEPSSAATIWYGKLLKLLSKRGMQKRPTQTPQEFLKSVHSPARRSVEAFTIHYERARFGDSASDAEKLPELYREVEEVTKS